MTDTDTNPFQAPESDVAPSPDQPNRNGTGNKNVKYQSVPILNGASWIVDGFRNFLSSPFKWLLVVFLYIAMLGTLSLLPFVSIIGSIIAPIFVAGLMICAHENKYQDGFRINNLFEGFSLNGGKLAGLGALNLGMIIGLFIVIAIIAVAIFFGTIGSLEEIETLFDPNTFNAESLLLILLVVLIAVAFILPITMAFWFAPALVIFHDVDIFAALKLSFMGCIKNMLPYLIYSLFYIIIYCIAAIPVFFLAAFIGDSDPNIIMLIITVLLALVEVLMFTAVFFTSIFASYEDIFYVEP